MWFTRTINTGGKNDRPFRRFPAATTLDNSAKHARSGSEDRAESGSVRSVHAVCVRSGDESLGQGTGEGTDAAEKAMAGETEPEKGRFCGNGGRGGGCVANAKVVNLSSYLIRVY